MRRTKFYPATPPELSWLVLAWEGAGLMVGVRAICLSRQTMSGVMKKMCL